MSRLPGAQLEGPDDYWWDICSRLLVEPDANQPYRIVRRPYQASSEDPNAQEDGSFRLPNNNYMYKVVKSKVRIVLSFLQCGRDHFDLISTSIPCCHAYG